MSKEPIELSYERPSNMMDFFNLGMARVKNNIESAEIVKDNFSALNLGPGNKEIVGTSCLDLPDYDASCDGIPYEDGSVDEIYALHFFEHLEDPVFCLQECQRVLKKGGLLFITVPYYNSILATQDLDHKQFFNENTWKILFRNKYYNKNKIEWKFEIVFNMIMGENQKNLALFTQLKKEEL